MSIYTDQEIPTISGKARLVWQIGGIAAILIGSYFLDGWPTCLIAFGLVVILFTKSDAMNDRLMLIWHAVR